MISEAHLDDCMRFMARFPDGFFDLALPDVPYGINVGNMAYLKETRTMATQKNGTRLNANTKKKPYTAKDWDLSPPPQAYFDELRRVSRHQIIWGVDYLDWEGLGPGRIKWLKGFAEGVSFKGYERAYCSLIDHERELPLLWAGMLQARSLSEPMVQRGDKRTNEKRFHPTQKPTLLYKRLLLDYARPGWKILDTHMGSQSSRIAACDLGFDFWGCDNDPEYFHQGNAWYQRHTSQFNLFHASTNPTHPQDRRG